MATVADRRYSAKANCCPTALFITGQSWRGPFVQVGIVSFGVCFLRSETLGPAQQLFHFGDQLIRNKWFYKVIGGAGLKRNELADMAAQTGQHENRDGSGGGILPQRFANGEPIQPRHHHIQ
jgi:hypothetical protein